MTLNRKSLRILNMNLQHQIQSLPLKLTLIL